MRVQSDTATAERGRAPSRWRPARALGLALLCLGWGCSRTPPPPVQVEVAAPSPARAPAPVMSYRGADWLTRPERTVEERPEAMLDALHVPQDGVVADIGAGVGYHSWRLAERVGPRGRVYATDLQPEMLALLESSMKERGITNVVAVRSGQDVTGLPDGAVDLALMVDVYHELAEPLRFLGAVRRALKPGGRLALVEFRAEDPEVPIRPEHKMTAEAVVRELKAGGFRLVQREEFLPWQHLLVFQPAVN